MSKKLNEMTLEELWRLFPIFLVEHNPIWAKWYEEEKKYILSLTKNISLKISHIGSTAIKNIYAKPIIDIIVELADYKEIVFVSKILENNNYLIMNKSENRISLNKGYTEKGFSEKVFHIHLRIVGDNDEIYFRDYLNKHFFIAKQYEKIKLSLSEKHQYNRDAYTEAKSEFVRKYTLLAKKEGV